MRKYNVRLCNAAETLLIDKKIADKFIPVMFKALKEKNVEIRADQNSKAIFADVNDVTDEDYYTEYNDYIMAVKVVDGIDEAIEHINKYNTKNILRRLLQTITNIRKSS